MATREELENRTKKCSRCGEIKMGTDYTVFKTTTGALSLMARCKPCRSTTNIEYRNTHPEYKAASLQYSKDYGRGYVRERRSQSMENNQAESLETATNNRKEWTGPELELLLRDDLTAVQLAEMLNRTYAAVRRMRAKCLRDPRKQVLAGTERGGL